MKIRMLVISVICFSLIGGTRADDLPRMGYSVRTPIKDLAAKGFRWIAFNGPYACPTEEDVRQTTSDRSELTEVHMVQEGAAYYLIPGTIVRVVQDDPVNGMSEVLLGGITRPLWTYTRFLTARPIRDTYGIVETPDTAGLIDPGDSAVGRSALNDRVRGGRP